MGPELNLNLDLEAQGRMELYCDVLVRYLLVESVLGDCELYRRMGAAIDSGDPQLLTDALHRFEALPAEEQARIMDGDPTLGTMMEHANSDSGDQVIPHKRRA